MGIHNDELDDIISADIGFGSLKIISGDITEIRDIIGSKRLENENAHEERVWNSGK